MERAVVQGVVTQPLQFVGTPAHYEAWRPVVRAAPTPWSNETVGYPSRCLTESDPHFREFFYHQIVMDTIITYVRYTDTPDACEMGTMFNRLAPMNGPKENTLKLKERTKEQLRDLVKRISGNASAARKEDLLDVFMKVACDLHYNRTVGTLANPTSPGTDFVVVKSLVDDCVVVYDVTPSNASARKIMLARPPARRPNSFAVDNKASPLYKRSCLYCRNRTDDKNDTFQVCSGCRTARYCSVACQTRDWVLAGHKGGECERWKKEREPED